MIDINELRRLTQAATPGPWYVTGKLTRYVEARIDGGLIQEVAACGPTKADGGYGPQQEANARLIAAANPAAITELLDRLEAAEKERDDAKAAAENIALKLDYLRSKLETAKNAQNDWLRANAPGGWIDNLRIENEALRAKIEALKQQKPVAWMSSRNGFICKENKNPEYNVPLKFFDFDAQTQGEEK